MLYEIRVRSVKLAFHDTDTDTDTDSPSAATILRPTHAISSRGSSRECRRVVQLATGITSGSVGRVGEDPREDVGVGVGAVEFQLDTVQKSNLRTLPNLLDVSVQPCMKHDVR